MVEDQVDAVVCAYVAWYADRHPDRVTRYGDPETGVIVTPSLGQPAATTGGTRCARRCGPTPSSTPTW